MPGITFYLQPVQDLTIDSVVSRAQYQFVLQAATSAALNDFVPKLLAELQKAQAMRNVSTAFLDKGLSAYLTVDRDTAARFGITAATIDNALYDSFGQRIISTIFTQSNQYRVILEADPSAAEFGGVAERHLSAHRRRRPGAAVGHRQGRAAPRAAADRSSVASSPPPPSPSTWRRAIRWARRWMPSRRPKPLPALPPGITTQFEGSAAGLPVGAWPTKCC